MQTLVWYNIVKNSGGYMNNIILNEEVRIEDMIYEGEDYRLYWHQMLQNYIIQKQK